MVITDQTRRRPAVALTYFALAVIGLVSTWVFNLSFFASGSTTNYLAAWFANPASSSAACDLIVLAVAGSVFMVVEGRRLGWRRRPWLFVIAGFAVAMAFVIPLFLGLRELALHREAPPDGR